MELEFSEKELKALKQEYASQATDAQFTLWIETCKRRGLVPVEDVVLQLRSVREYDEVAKTKVYVKKVVFITTLRALLKLAESTGNYRGFVPVEYIYVDESGRFSRSEFPLPDPKNPDKPLIPWAAKAGVKREGFDEPQYEIARFWAYAQTWDDDGKKKLNSTWTTRGPEQLVKCARAASLRASFPEKCGDLFLAEELQNEESAPKSGTKSDPPKSTAPTAAPAAPQVNHTPAEGKAEPRPGEKTAVVDTTSPGPPTSQPEPTVPPEPPAASEKREKKVRSSRKKPDPAVASSGTEIKPEPGKPGIPLLPAAEPIAAAPASDDRLDRLPTAEEFNGVISTLTVFRDRLGGAGSEGSNNLRRFIVTTSGQPDTKTVTARQWEAIIKTLNSALDDNDLKAIVSGK